MSVMASQITCRTIVYLSAYSGTDQRKKSKVCITGLCEGNSPVTGEFPTQRASNVENVSMGKINMYQTTTKQNKVWTMWCATRS